MSEQLRRKADRSSTPRAKRAGLFVDSEESHAPRKFLHLRVTPKVSEKKLAIVVAIR